MAPRPAPLSPRPIRIVDHEREMASSPPLPGRDGGPPATRSQ